MEKENFLEKLTSQFSQNASVKNVYGEPIRAGSKTIIPVARIAFGLGGGYGQGFKKNKRSQTTGDAKPGNDANGEGAGGGGGLYAKPQGVYEITESGTRFIPVTETRQLLIGLAVGFLIRSWFFKRLRKK
jgi:uncharacterized spore protein YtfJ